jgi:hypothetical protein
VMLTRRQKRKQLFIITEPVFVCFIKQIYSEVYPRKYCITSFAIHDINKSKVAPAPSAIKWAICA